MREYHNGNEVGTSQLRWIGSSPPSLTKRLGAAGVAPGRPGGFVKKLTSKIFKLFSQKHLTNEQLCGIIYTERKRGHNQCIDLIE